MEESLKDKDATGCSPWHVAAMDGKLDVIQRMLELGANVDEKSKTGLTAFFISLYRGHWEVLQFLAKLSGEALLEDCDLPLV